MNLMEVANIHQVLSQNFKNYLRIRRKKRQPRPLIMRKWRKFLNLKCERQLKHGLKVLLSKTIWDLKSCRVSDNIDDSRWLTKSMEEMVMEKKEILRSFEKNGNSSHKNNDLAKSTLLNAENACDDKSINEVITISQSVVDNKPDLQVPKKIVNIRNSKIRSSSQNTKTVNTVRALEAQNDNNLQIGLGSSNQAASSSKEIKDDDQSVDDFTQTYSEVQNEFNENNDKKNDLRRSSRTKTPCLYNEQMSHISFGYAKKVNAKIDSSPTLKKSSSPPVESNPVKEEYDSLEYCRLQIKKMGKNASSSVELVLPKSISNTLTVHPLKITIDLEELDLSRFVIEKNRQEQELANIKETAAATAVLTGAYVPPEPKQNKPRRKRKPKREQKTPIAQYIEQFSTNDDVEIQTQSADFSTAPRIYLTQTSSGWITTHSLGSNCNASNDNIVGTNNLMEQNEVILADNSIIQMIPTIDLPLNNLFPLNTLLNNGSNQILQNVQLEAENVRENIQIDHLNQLREIDQPDMTINKQNIVETKSLKRKINDKIEYIKLGNHPEKSNSAVIRLKKLIPANKPSTSYQQRGLDMPSLDLDSSNHDSSANAKMTNENDNLMDCIALNALSIPMTSVNITKPSISNGCVEISVKENKKTTKENTKEIKNNRAENKIQNNALEKEIQENASENTLPNNTSENTIANYALEKTIQNNSSENTIPVSAAAPDNTKAVHYLNDLIRTNDKMTVSNHILNDNRLEADKKIDDKEKSLHPSGNSDQLCSSDILSQENIEKNNSSQCTEMGNEEMENCIEAEINCNDPSTSNNVIESNREENDIRNYVGFHDDELDFEEDDAISILGDYDRLGDEFDRLGDEFNTPNVNNSNNILQNNGQQKISSTSIEESCSIFEDNYIDTDIFGLPRQKPDLKFKIPKKNNKGPSDSLNSKDPPINVLTLSADQCRTPMCWPNNPTNIVKHPDQLKVLEPLANKRSAEDERSYHNNISASKLFGGPCFKFLDFGKCHELHCRYQHFLIEPEVLKFQFRLEQNKVVDLAYQFVKEKRVLFHKYAQIFIEIFAERNNRLALLGMVAESKNYEHRISWWRSIWMALLQMNFHKYAALEMILKEIPTDDPTNIDFAIELIIEVDVLKFLQNIQEYNNIPSYLFKMEIINKMACIYFETKSLDLQNTLFSIILKVAKVKSYQQQLKHPTILDFLKICSDVGQPLTYNIEYAGYD